jgi:hypothetical protein
MASPSALGDNGDTFVLAPPFVTRDDTLARIAEILGAAAKAVLG